MRIIRGLFLSILVLILLALAFAWMQPDRYTVTRSIQIQATPEQIYPYLAAPKAWKDWSVWNQRDPAMQIQYSGPASGTGAVWQWQSRTQGNGSMRFTEAQPARLLRYELQFEGMGPPSTGSLLLEAQTGGSKLTWEMQGNNQGQLLMKLFTPFMDRMLGPDFAAGLANLKKHVEQK